MSNLQKILFYFLLANFFITIHSDPVFEITEVVKDNPNYKKIEFENQGTNFNLYFKTMISDIPSSKINGLRIIFDQFNEMSYGMNKVFCTFVNENLSDERLIETVRMLREETSSCVGLYNEVGTYDGIIRYPDKIDSTNRKLAIYMVVFAIAPFTGRLYLRTAEKMLNVGEGEIMEEEYYSLVPLSVVISNFRESASKILFYSHQRELQIYYPDKEVPYPMKLFSGNIMSIYTNPNMVRQKYNNQNILVLLSRGFDEPELIGEKFKFHVKLFSSSYLLDYFVSNNPNGRSKNSPLAINMTSCENPYYVILNYNQPEKETSLYADYIYGKIRSLAVAPNFKKQKWDDMIMSDMTDIEISHKKFILPPDSPSHIDVYKIECEIPLLINFYFVDESEKIPEINFGQVVIKMLKPYKSISLPFAQGINLPQLTIEVFNPVKSPLVIVSDGQNQNVVEKNQIIKSLPLSTINPIVIKEKGGDTETRVIIKVGFNPMSFTEISPNIKYSSALNMFIFSFPINDANLNYTKAKLVTKGTYEDDNIKYCYGTNLGSPILPSNENCYRVSLENWYTLYFLNPSVIYKNYDYSDDLNYYVSIKPVVLVEKMEVTSELMGYDTSNRFNEGVNNVANLDGEGKFLSILTFPPTENQKILVQIQQCVQSELKYEVLNAYEPSKIVVEEKKIPSDAKFYFDTYNNIFLETELVLRGNPSSKIFVKYSHIKETYSPSINFPSAIDFKSDLNQLILTRPVNSYEPIKYIVLVSEQGGISSKGINLCNFEDNINLFYKKIVESSDEKISVSINFGKIGLNYGQNFEAIIYYEQVSNSKMSFVSTVYTGIVGKVSIDTITEIKTVYPTDDNYVYQSMKATPSEMTYYFSYMPQNEIDFPVGAFRIELDTNTQGEFTDVDCAFVNEDDDAMTMVEAVEEVIESKNPFCIGGKSTTNKRNYNYIFRYSLNEEKKPKKLVIKVTNGKNVDGNFNIYLRKGAHTYIEKTEFSSEKVYGKDEEYKKSIIPYIVDLKKLRDNSSGGDYISKVLFYSKDLEMQMYYIDDTENIRAPILLFSGYVMLTYTKVQLALQKYHSTTLLLLSENLMGQEHSSLGNNFRFHTKMFTSEEQIEYFVSNNQNGRTLNYPLSLDISTCTKYNNRYYYILNYNKEEPERILYLDAIFGSMKKARASIGINQEKWSDLIYEGMLDISDYQITLPKNEKHIDIVEIICNTPLLLNAYYNYENQEFSGLERGDIVVKNLEAKKSVKITMDNALSGTFYFSISLFNPKENPDISFNFGNKTTHTIKENALQTGFLLSTPDNIAIVNNGNSNTRFIFKIGYDVESEWEIEKENYEGTLFSKGNKYVYKFPLGDKKKNFTDVQILVKGVRQGSTQEAQNVKFCYSTSIGTAIDTSRENCYRTGEGMQISLPFLNPLIFTKNYKSYADNYYITFSPWNENEYISLIITENKYNILERNIEGISNIVKLENSTEKSTILSVSELPNSQRILVQLQSCSNIKDINYTNIDYFNKEIISTGVLKKYQNYFVYALENTLMETEIKFNGVENDNIFVKHIGYSDYVLIVENYYTKFEQEQNIVNIIKPIKDEEFKFTVLVGKPGKFDDYSLCTFSEISEKDYSSLGDYVMTFTSSSSNIITHFIDFRSFHYEENQGFDLLVYAVQQQNTKVEFLYDVMSGIVGKIKGPTKIEGTIEGKNDYATQLFIQNTTNNYLFYDFNHNPTGDVASMKITDYDSQQGMIVNKIYCVFVRKDATDEEMITSVNKAAIEKKSVCVGEKKKDTNGFDALVNARDVANGYARLVIQVVYGLGQNSKIKNEEKTLNITIKTNGYQVDTPDYPYNEDEQLTPVPYVFDLKKIREKEKDRYISKILLYSNSRELQMFYLDNGAPVELFSGNILLVYTNEEVVKEKYHGANIMIMLTDSLSSSKITPEDEKFRFKANFFDSAKTIQYYVSGNPNGRLLNNPTSIEMLSCDQPYYYILNYHATESIRLLHIDTIFGVIDKIKISYELIEDNWYDFTQNMIPFSGYEYYIAEQKNYHIDVLEVTCKTPLLLNIYYTDPVAPKKSNLDQGDIAIVGLYAGAQETLSFKLGLYGEYIYNFFVMNEYNQIPNLLIDFENEDELIIKQNGIYNKRTDKNYALMTINNMKVTGFDETKIIFKFGYVIENTFTKIQNDVYNLQTEDRPGNLFAYKFKTGEDRLNYTKIIFNVRTSEPNVKFCYATNLGAFIDPSMQNCFRVGRANSYNISILNPYLMYKNYYLSEDVIDYYVSFKTENISQNITIVPYLNKYSTNLRNFENVGNVLHILETGNTSSILTPPNLNSNYTFVQMCVCTVDRGIEYQFMNAYNNTSLGVTGQIVPNLKTYYRNIPNINLDTEIIVISQNATKVYVKHVGLNEEFKPLIKEFDIKYNSKITTITFNQPIQGENFNYTILVDKKGNLEKQAYTLCSIVESTKLAHYSYTFNSSEETVSFKIDFQQEILKGYEEFSLLIIAEELDNGKLILMSDVYSYSIPKDEKKSDEEEGENSNKTLIIVIIILLIVIVIGLMISIYFIRKKCINPHLGKNVSFSEIKDTNPQENLVTSLNMSQASEKTQ